MLHYNHTGSNIRSLYRVNKSAKCQPQRDIKFQAHYNMPALVSAQARENDMRMCTIVCVLIFTLLMISADASEKADGYKGIWYYNQPSEDKYAYKYSGGLATYTAKHIPLAVYVPKAHKTFFVFGGSRGLGSKTLLIAIGYYDHKTGMVSKPTVIAEEDTTDAHCNPAMTIDNDGYIWVFAPTHGGTKDGIYYKSKFPLDIDEFRVAGQKRFSYPQPWYFDGFGHMLLFTKYTDGRELYVSDSTDGITWAPDQKIVGFGGHYQVSWAHGRKRGTACDWHPPVGGLNARTNLYYLESSDFGRTWTNAAGKVLNVPLNSPKNDALVREYQVEHQLVYVKDLDFDERGRPVILYVLSHGFESGPKNGQRVWTTARWTGSRWDFRKVTTSDHNYDTGSLYIEKDGTWRVIGPSAPGPQAWGTGGDVEIWTSKNQGKTWTKLRQVTNNSSYNHSHVRRPVNAHPDFYTFWADGDPFKPSESRLFFTNKTGDKVWMLPEKMTKDFEHPTALSEPLAP